MAHDNSPYRPTTERLYERLPAIFRELDGEQPIPPSVDAVEERFNYVLNPNADTWVGGEEVLRNLVPNPSFEGTDATTVPMFRNVITNPAGRNTAGTVTIMPGSGSSPDPDWTLSGGNLLAPAPVGWTATNAQVYYSTTRDMLAIRITNTSSPFASFALAGVAAGVHTHLTEIVPAASNTAPGPQVGVQVTSRGTGASSGALPRLVLRRIDTLTAGPGAWRLTFTNVAVGDIFYFRAALIPDLWTGRYFDGSTDLPGTNKAQRALVTAAGTGTGDITTITAGNTSTTPYFTTTANQVTVDLGVPVLANRVRIWHFYGDQRTYQDARTEVSADGENWTTVYDAAVQGPYVETVGGKPIDFDSQMVRYVRDYARHNDKDSQGRWAEIQVFDTTPELTPAWEGTANASASVLRAQTILGYDSPASGRHGAISSAKWHLSGTRALRLMPVANHSSDVFAMSTPLLEEGTIYTLSGTCRVVQPLASPRSRHLAMGIDDSRIVQAPNAVGEHTVALTFVATDHDDEILFTHGGGLNDADVYWDDVMLVKGYSTDYFWGEQPSDLDFAYTWTGDRNNSSTRKASLRTVAEFPAEGTSPVQSSVWATRGSRSVRLVNTSLTTRGRIKVADLDDLEGGKTYIVSATFRATEAAAQVGFPHRSISWESNLGVVQTTPTLQVGSQRLNLSFTVLPGTSSGAVYLYNGGFLGEPDVWWDAVMVTEGNEVIAYFDGGMVGHEWVGEEGHSYSRKIPRAATPGGFPLKKYISSFANIQDDIDELIARFTYIPADIRDQVIESLGYHFHDRPVTLGATSDIVDGRTADDDWLPWIAQLLGLNVDRFPNPTDLRNAVVVGLSGARVGSTGAIEAAVKAHIVADTEDDREISVYPHTIDLASEGLASIWDFLIVTRASAAPDPAALLAAVASSGAKPAGMVLHHQSFTTTWENVEGFLPTWEDWENAGSWQGVEEVGF
jgi:hypothetical protein